MEEDTLSTLSVFTLTQLECYHRYIRKKDYLDILIIENDSDCYICLTLDQSRKMRDINYCCIARTYQNNAPPSYGIRHVLLLLNLCHIQKPLIFFLSR